MASYALMWRSDTTRSSDRSPVTAANRLAQLAGVVAALGELIHRLLLVADGKVLHELRLHILIDLGDELFVERLGHAPADVDVPLTGELLGIQGRNELEHFLRHWQAPLL